MLVGTRGPVRAQTQARAGPTREHFYGPEDLFFLKAICKADYKRAGTEWKVLSSIFKTSVGETPGGVDTSGWVASFVQASEWNLAFRLGGQAVSHACGWVGGGLVPSDSVFSPCVRCGTLHCPSFGFEEGEK